MPNLKYPMPSLALPFYIWPACENLHILGIPNKLQTVTRL